MIVGIGSKRGGEIGATDDGAGCQLGSQHGSRSGGDGRCRAQVVGVR
jgi:hypothetical protein